MILASAGSGKTWQLTNRYIGLMALQFRSGREVAPERILAATFTRKAAGEFFDSILVKLADAASDATKAASLGGDPEDPLAPVLATLAPEDYTQLLRVFIRRMPRLFLGTLDSFFANLLRAFPTEFGLTGDFEVMDDYEAALARSQVYEVVFSPPRSSTGKTDTTRSAFLEAFRLATLGSEENRVLKQLDGFIDDLHERYLEAPAASLWGNAEAIWDDAGRHWFPGEIDSQKEALRLETALRSIEAAGRKIEWKWWTPFLASLSGHRPGLPLAKPIEYVAERVLSVWNDVVAGSAEVKFNRTVQLLDRSACDPLRSIFQWIVSGELSVKLRRTGGVREVLERYESVYHEQVRRRGKLTFQDAQLLLAGRGGAEQGEAPLFSQSPGPDERLRIDYRLDARYDHWLLDEFQDTNLLQWRVIANLIDEVVQDESGTRSLFQVGDLKQAIYAWRGGDTRLFTDIANRYNTHGERLRRRHLDISWRSGHDVIDPVNRVFGDRAALAGMGLPESALAQWEWHDHRVSPKGEGYEGCTFLLHPAPASGDKPEAEDIHDLVAGILKEIDPVRRGLSCAVLVQKNCEGEALVDALRTRLSIPVVSESEIFIATDNPLNRALLSLFQIAAHPGDRFAWQHLAMGPLGLCENADLSTPAALSSHLLLEIFETGFEKTTRDWTARLQSALGTALDTYTKGRAEEFALAARSFDESGNRNIDEFLLYLGNYRIRDAASTNAVQVMTIHKAKGLTFDAVILPDLGGTSLTTARRGFGVKKNEAREVAWILDLPRKEFVAADPVLRESAAESEAEAAYESLCKFYVAMTRASRANYLITMPRGESATSQNFVKLLEDTLAGEPVGTEFGDIPATVLFQSDTARTNRRWFAAFHRREGSPETTPEPVRSVAPAWARKRPNRRTPSGSEEATISAAQLFHPGGSAAREFGTLVHAIFEEIEWAGETEVDSLAVHWRETFAHRPGLEDAIAQVSGVLVDPTTRRALAHPGGNAEAWREQSFEVLLDEEWLSGTFDRVVIERSAVGAPERASILDFKTDRVGSPEEIDAAVIQYRPQLATYREVLRRITGLPASAIRCHLLFTRSRTLREL